MIHTLNVLNRPKPSCTGSRIKIMVCYLNDWHCLICVCLLNLLCRTIFFTLLSTVLYKGNMSKSFCPHLHSYKRTTWMINFLIPADLLKSRTFHPLSSSNYILQDARPGSSAWGPSNMGECENRRGNFNSFFTNRSDDKIDDQIRWSNPQVDNQVVETLTQWAAVMIQLRLTCMIIMKLVFTVFSLLSIISRNKFSLRVIHNFPNSLLAKT